MTTWRKYLLEKMGKNGESWSDVIATEKDAAIDEVADGDWPHHFWVWTDKNVYFPVVGDGNFGIGIAPRNPQPEGQHHVGGE